MGMSEGVTEISRYLFSDEGAEKGILKVYIEAKELGSIERFTEATVSFQKQSFSARLTSSDGCVWAMSVSRLFSCIKPPESRYSVSSSGKRVSITLKKADAGTAWPRL